MDNAGLFRKFADSTQCGTATVLVSCPKCYARICERIESVNKFSEWSYIRLGSFEQSLYKTKYLGHSTQYCAACKP